MEVSDHLKQQPFLNETPELYLPPNKMLFSFP